MGTHASDNAMAEKQRQDRYADLVRYGQRLYQELFGKTDSFRSYLTDLGGARIILRLHSTASELWNIPWEYIHDGEKFLGIRNAPTLCRSL